MKVINNVREFKQATKLECNAYCVDCEFVAIESVMKITEVAMKHLWETGHHIDIVYSATKGMRIGPTGEPRK